MLTSLHLQNFKCWRDTGSIRLAPITGLFGTNNSGKSSILQFLLMLAQTIYLRDRTQVLNFGDDRIDLVRLGMFRDVLYRDSKGKQADSLEWTIEWTLPEELILVRHMDEHKVLSTEQMKFHAVVEEVILGAAPHLTVKCFDYEFANKQTGRNCAVGMEYVDEFRYQLVNRGVSLRRVPGQVELLPRPLNFYGFPSQIERYYRGAIFLLDFSRAFDELIQHTYYLDVSQQYPARQYRWVGRSGLLSYIGSRGEYTIPVLLSSRQYNGEIDPSQKHRESLVAEEQVVRWLQRLKLIHAFSIEETEEGSGLYCVRVQQTPDSAFVLLPDVGLGVSQVLPLLTLCYCVPEGATILLEQPEIHLHPSVQAGLADVFIEVAMTRNIQILFESHSEHLLTRLQRRIAEEQVAAGQVALYFCQKDAVEAHLTPLMLDAYGNITNWPKGFFGDEFGDRAAMVEAAMERRKRETEV